MDQPNDGRQARSVRLQTLQGAVEGALLTSPVVRTLDDLNIVSRNFLTIHAPKVCSGRWALDEGPLAISKTAVLYVLEFHDTAAVTGLRAETLRFFRSAVRLWLGDYSIQGFVHVPPGGSAMARLNQTSHAFLALTSVSVVGPDVEFATPFLAVHRAHILGAQQLATAADPAEADPLEAVEAD